MFESTLCKAVDGGTTSDQEKFMAAARNTWGSTGRTAKGSIVSNFFSICDAEYLPQAQEQ